MGARTQGATLVPGGTGIVLLSGRGEEAQRSEGAVRDAGVAWTIVRASRFAQSFGERFLRGAVLAGEVALPVDRIREPFIGVEDVAEDARAAAASGAWDPEPEVA